MSLKWIQDAIGEINLASKLDAETLSTIENDVIQGYKEDKQSRTGWETRQDSHMKLALQVMEEKNTPWPNASNIKYPLLTTATMQFGARAYPALIQSPNIVKGRVTGFDSTGEKAKSAERVGKHMSYQLIEEMDGWEEDMDKLSVSLPIVGCMFKKTYFSPSKQTNVSELVYPMKLVVNYWTKSLKDSPRITHELDLTDNQIFERIASGLFVDQEYHKRPVEENKTSNEIHGITPPSQNETSPHECLEQHVWIDLDDDGYKEPYIVTVLDGKLARIVAGWDEDGIYASGDKLLCIKRIEYFTKYGFVPNPDGSFYDIGFGTLLGPINETINSTLNQLMDAGTLSNRSGGFLGRGARLKGGVHSFSPFQWNTVQSTGDDLRKAMVPLPVREPSAVLFSLLGMMVDAGKELSNTVPMLLGQNPGQNQPATTSIAVIEQGLKVFSAIFKRMHRSLKYELKALKRLNRIYLPPQSYFKVLDLPEVKGEQGEPVDGRSQVFQLDYSEDVTDVQPYSDPNIVSDTQRMLKAQQVSEMMAQNLLPNPQAGARIVLEALDLPNIDELLTPPEPQPDPELILKQQQFEHKKQLEQARLKLDGARLALDEDIADDQAKVYETQCLLNLAKAEAAEDGTQIGIYKQELDRIRLTMDARQRDKQEKMNERAVSGMARESSNTAPQ